MTKIVLTLNDDGKGSLQLSGNPVELMNLLASAMDQSENFKLMTMAAYGRVSGDPDLMKQADEMAFLAIISMQS